jgi:hypothetical protein
MCCGSKSGGGSDGQVAKKPGNMNFNKNKKKFAKIVLLGNVAVGNKKKKNLL